MANEMIKDEFGHWIRVLPDTEDGKIVVAITNTNSNNSILIFLDKKQSIDLIGEIEHHINDMRLN